MKVLVIHATAGAGHKKAAEAVHQAVVAQGHQAQLVDALDYTNPFFKSTYPSTYALMVTKFPLVWQVCFGMLDIPALQPVVHFIRRCYNGFNAAKLQQFMIDEKFDAIITTQFLSAEVSAYLKRSGKIRAKVICVVTDFDVHRIWINKGIDVYTGASPFTKDKLVSLGIPADKSFVTGIPTDTAFAQQPDKTALMQKLGLKPGMFTVLVATGSFGMGPIKEMIARLKGYQVVVVCGHNKSLCAQLKEHPQKDAHILGLVNNMYELMSVADVMITKPGGLSIAEALVKKLPMLFFSAIPGQETQNVMVLKQYGAGFDQMSIDQIVSTIDDLNAAPEKLAQLRNNLAVLSKPSAAADIARLI